MRFALAGFSHETNTFASGLATYERFAQSGILRGSEIVRYAEQIMRLGESLAAHVGTQHALVGTFRMGVADSFAMTHLPALLARFARLHPAAQLELDIDFSANLDRKLHRGELDIAFLHAPTPGPTLVVEPLMRFALSWFASPALKLPATVLGPGDLADVPILSNPRPSHLYASIIDWFGSAGLAACSGFSAPGWGCAACGCAGLAWAGWD